MLGFKNTNTNSMLFCFQSNSSKEKEREREASTGANTHVLRVEIKIGSEFILSSEDVHYIGRHITRILGPERTLGRGGTCCEV